MKYIYWISFILFFLLTLVGLDTSTGNFVFAGGSDGLMEIRTVNIWIKIFLLLASGFFLINFHKNKGIKNVFLCVFFIFIWFLSGRTIATFPDGRISTGWFYIETNKILLCNGELDCETITHYKTTVETKKLWVININSVNSNYAIFVGPFIWSDTIKLLNESYSH